MSISSAISWTRLLLLATAGVALGATAKDRAGTRRLDNGETLILNEEFDSFNLDLWQHEITMGGGGNWEFQMYGNNRTNSYVEDGKLILQPTLTSDYLGPEQVSGAIPTTFDLWGLVPADQCTSNMFYGCSRGSNLGARIAINPVMSARVRTAGTFSFRYGRIEVKAKLPRGDWLWPAIWLLPEKNAYGQWPASGEIDIMESRGNAPSYGAGVDDIGGVDTSSSAVHWGPHYTMDSWDQTYGTYALEEGTFNDDFHTFGLYWDEKEMYTYIDDDSNRVLTVDFGKGTDKEGFWEKGHFEERFPGVQNPWSGADRSAPYDQKFYVVMNVAVGGVSGFFPDDVGSKMWNNKDPDAAMKFFEATSDWYSTWNGKDAAMQVESVKVWQTNEDYFLEPRAAATAGLAASNGRGSASPEDQDRDTSTLVADGGVREPASSRGGASSVLLYAMCSALGGMLGGIAVGLWLGKSGARNMSRVYESINGGGRTTPSP
eukprot:g6605.t1